MAEGTGLAPRIVRCRATCPPRHLPRRHHPYRGIRCECPIHAAGTTWLGHPRRINDPTQRPPGEIRSHHSHSDHSAGTRRRRQPRPTQQTRGKPVTRRSTARATRRQVRGHHRIPVIRRTRTTPGQSPDNAATTPRQRRDNAATTRGRRRANRQNNRRNNRRDNTGRDGIAAAGQWACGETVGSPAVDSAFTRLIPREEGAGTG
jgi:hypothetical protein